MIHVAVLDDYVRCAEEFGDWKSLEGEAEVTFFAEAIPPEQLTTVLAPYEVVVITQERTRFPREVLFGLPNLRLIVTNRMMSTVVDQEATRERGIVLCGSSGTGSRGGPGQSTQPGITSPAEMAWALIFAVTKRVSIEDRAVRAGAWGTGFPATLGGMTLGLAGLGHLGGKMVAPARAFGMDVIAWSQNLTDERTAELGARRVTKEELLRGSDVLGIFLKLSERSRGLFGAGDLALLKPTSYIVNISRGPIIDEPALLDVLRAGRIAGAGLDVFDREPLPVDHPLRAMENVVLMPHLGYVTEAGFRSSFSQAVEDIAAFIAGEPIRVIA